MKGKCGSEELQHGLVIPCDGKIKLSEMGLKLKQDLGQNTITENQWN